MSRPLKYIKDLEAAGFQRNQAEAQVQMVLDAIEGDLVTKSDFAVFQERTENRLSHFQQHFENRFTQFEQQIETRFTNFEQKVETRFSHSQQQTQVLIKESEFRLITRLGFLTVSTASIGVAVLTWLIKL